MSEKGKKNKKKTGLGLAIWILLFLIILIVFLVKQEEIKENFDKSGATALIEKKIGKDIFEDKKDESKNEENGETIIDLTKNIRKTEPIAKSEIAEKTEDKKSEVTLKNVEKTEKKQNAVKDEPSQSQASKGLQEKKEVPAKQTKQAETKKEVTVAAPKAETNAASQVAPNTIKAKICFVAIDSEGPVVRKQVTRNVHKDSPMADALNMLLSGPSSAEEKTGCRSLIPAGSRLLSASVKNGIAILNFSEEFQFNQFGVEGSLAQLMQVVYTATEFSTVKGVQILLEGQKREYLTEGVWIGSPLNRNSF